MVSRFRGALAGGDVQVRGRLVEGDVLDLEPTAELKDEVGLAKWGVASSQVSNNPVFTLSDIPRIITDAHFFLIGISQNDTGCK